MVDVFRGDFLEGLQLFAEERERFAAAVGEGRSESFGVRILLNIEEERGVGERFKRGAAGLQKTADLNEVGTILNEAAAGFDAGLNEFRQARVVGFLHVLAVQPIELLPVDAGGSARAVLEVEDLGELLAGEFLHIASGR